MALRYRKWLIEQNSGHSLMQIPQENGRGLVLGPLLQPALSCTYLKSNSQLGKSLDDQKDVIFVTLMPKGFE